MNIECRICDENPTKSRRKVCCGAANRSWPWSSWSRNRCKMKWLQQRKISPILFPFFVYGLLRAVSWLANFPAFPSLECVSQPNSLFSWEVGSWATYLWPTQTKCQMSEHLQDYVEKASVQTGETSSFAFIIFSSLALHDHSSSQSAWSTLCTLCSSSPLIHIEGGLRRSWWCVKHIFFCLISLVSVDSVELEENWKLTSKGFVGETCDTF